MKTLRDEDTETGRRHEMWDGRELRLAILYAPSHTADGVRSYVGTPDTACSIKTNFITAKTL